MKVKIIDGCEKYQRIANNGDYHKVLEYVSQDVKATLALAQAIRDQGELRWVSRAGRPNQCDMPLLLTVKEAIPMPPPDTSWMSNPWPRSKFYGWIEGSKVNEETETAF